jgi:hypothetical protein
VLINAVDRTSGAVQSIGFWTGQTNESFTVGGVARVFYGAGSVLGPPDIVYEAGMNINAATVRFSPFSSLFNDAIRLYDVRQQKASIHRAFFSTATEQLIEAPQRIFKGRSDKLSITEAAEEGSSEATLTVVSSMRALTRGFAAKWSDTTFLKRSGDRLMKYSDTAGAVNVVWGNIR